MTAPDPSVATAAEARDTTLLVLILLIAFGAILRLHGIGGEGLWMDEAATWQQTRGDIVSTIIITGKDTYPPLHNLLVLLSVHVFGDAEWALRLPATLLSILCIPAIFWVGRLTAGPKVGLIAAALISLSPFAIYYAQEARMYALLMLAATLFAGATIAWLRGASFWRAVALVATGFALVYSHPYGALAWFCIGAAALIVLIVQTGWRRLLGYAGLQLAIFMLFAPWILVMLRVTTDVLRVGFWIARPDLPMLFSYLLDLGGGPLGLGLLAAGWIVALPLAGKILRPANSAQQSESAKPDAVVVLLALAIGPLLIGFLLSQVTTPILVARYVICSLPAAALLAAIGFARLAPTATNLALPLGLICLLLAPPNAIARQPRHAEDWRSIAAYLRANVRPDDCVVVDAGHGSRVLEYYAFEPPACYFTASRAAEGKIGTNRLIAIHGGSDLTDIKRAFPGHWTDEQNFGAGLALAIRAPAP